MQSFLGFTNFYCQFIDNYSEIATPLMCLTRKHISWDFITQCQQAFSDLKIAFTSAPVLTNFNTNALIMVKSDVSDYAIVAILTIRDPYNNDWHPAAFHS